MNRKSLSFKMFLTTALAFVGLITLMMILQLAFFERYYVDQKSAAFKRDFNQIMQKLKENPDPASFSDFLTPFQSKNYALAGIGAISGDRILLRFGKGEVEGSGVIRKQLNITEPGSESAAGPEAGPLPDKLLASAIPNPEADNLMLALSNWMKDREAYQAVMVQKQTIFKRMDSAFSGKAAAQQLAAIAPLNVSDDGEGTFVIAVSSFQPVGDAVMMFRSFYLYFYILAVVFIVLLAFLYSNMITKPLRALNKVALRMARLDFAAKSAIRRNDEIGNLSGTLDFLSENLQRALGELKTANAKLQTDMEKEKRLERLRREFVAGVSHDLKTPISLIRGYAEGLLDNLQEGKKRERYARIILEESTKMAEMVRDMLDLSQLEAGHYQLKPETFRLDSLVRSIVDKHESMLSDKRVELDLTPAGVHADRSRIEQVLANLLDNAGRHAPSGGRIRVEMHVNLGRASIGIWNEGERIPEDELPYIWEHFYKVEKSRGRAQPLSGSFHGSGIGLSIVRQILVLHGSEFGVRNTDDGVLFFFTLQPVPVQEILASPAG